MRGMAPRSSRVRGWGAGRGRRITASWLLFFDLVLVLSRAESGWLGGRLLHHVLFMSWFVQRGVPPPLSSCCWCHLSAIYCGYSSFGFEQAGFFSFGVVHRFAYISLFCSLIYPSHVRLLILCTLWMSGWRGEPRDFSEIKRRRCAVDRTRPVRNLKTS
jgi:hypothetical protein